MQHIQRQVLYKYDIKYSIICIYEDKERDFKTLTSVAIGLVSPKHIE